MPMWNTNLIGVVVAKLQLAQDLACGGGGDSGAETIISPKFQMSGI